MKFYAKANPLLHIFLFVEDSILIVKECKLCYTLLCII